MGILSACVSVHHQYAVVLSFHSEGLWDRAQVTGLDTKHLLYLLSHLTYPETDL